MKANIHPQYHADAKIVCACGNIIEAGSTERELHVEICSNCHPYYTGKTILVDTTGTVDKFRKRAEKASQIAATKTVKKPRKSRTSTAEILKPENQTVNSSK